MITDTESVRQKIFICLFLYEKAQTSWESWLCFSVILHLIKKMVLAVVGDNYSSVATSHFFLIRFCFCSFSDLEVWRITGQRFTPLCTSWQRSLSGKSRISHSMAWKFSVFSCADVKQMCVCSPMLRMSFIVFSTRGNIIMKLTENR